MPEQGQDNTVNSYNPATAKLNLERRAEAAEARVAELEAERDQARDLCKDYEAYLDDALTALGVKTVFDIPVAQKGQQQ